MIVVADYGMGNLRSVSKALEHLGAPVKVSQDPRDLQDAEKIVLPGVGAFGDAIKELQKQNLFDALKEQFLAKKKIFGICLGLQLFMEKSEESPGTIGLEFLEGDVVKFKPQAEKIPHMGWNTVTHKNNHPLLEGVPSDSFFYFVHSYYVDCKRSENKLGVCDYAGSVFDAMAGNDHLFATQFHPEKSQAVGLQILKNFIRW
jgi:glutamine amidotransferase